MTEGIEAASAARELPGLATRTGEDGAATAEGTPPAGHAGAPGGMGAAGRGPRPSVSKAVAHVLERDAVAREGLARGIVNLRALSRALIEAQGWTASEEAVLSALRRHAATGRSGAAPGARAALARAHLRTRSRMGTLLLPRTRQARALLGLHLHALEGPGDDGIVVIETPKGIKLILSEERFPGALRALAEVGVREGARGLTLVELALPPEARQAPGAFALACGTLAGEGVPVVEAFMGASEFVLLVPERETLHAYEALHALVGRSGEPPRSR